MNKEELLELITEESRTKVENVIENELAEIEKELLNELDNNDCEHVVDLIQKYALNIQDLAYKKGIEQGMKIEWIDNYYKLNEKND
jgi:hypothetical protein